MFSVWALLDGKYGTSATVQTNWAGEKVFIVIFHTRFNKLGIKKRTSKLPWVSKGWYQGQAEQRHSTLRTRLWTGHRGRLRRQGGVCGRTGPHRGFVKSHRLSLPLQPASIKSQSGDCRTVGVDEWMNKTMLPFYIHSFGNFCQLASPSADSQTINRWRSPCLMGWKYHHLLKSHLAPVEFPWKIWDITHSVTTTVPVKHYGTLWCNCYPIYNKKPWLMINHMVAFDGSKPMTLFQQKMVP